MAKKKVEVASQTKEDKVLEKESNRLRELALSRGLLSEQKAVAEVPLHPNIGILRCDGKDVCKKGHRKNKYLFSFPGLVAPVAGGKFGDLTQLDSRNPVLYVDFPQGRLKLFGTILYPKNKYITLNFVRGAGNIQCEDIFESLVVFSEAWWIGTKENNPDELQLDMPLDLQQEKHAVYDFAGGAGKARNPKNNADVQPSQPPVQPSQLEPSKLSTPKAQLKMDQWLSHTKVSENKSSDSNAKAKHRIENEWESDEGDEGDEGFVNLGDEQTPSRQSARTAGKKYSYVESSSEEKETDDSGGDDDLEAERRESEGKTTNKFYRRKDANDSFLAPESQASKMDVADPCGGSLHPDVAVTMDVNDDEETDTIDHLAASQTSAPRSIASDLPLSDSILAVANASTARAGSKQSSLSAFFLKSSEEEKVTNVELPISSVKVGVTRTYQRTKIKQSTLEADDAKEDGSLMSKSEMEPVLLDTPPESNGSKRKRKFTSEGKPSPKGSGRKGTSPGKRRKKATEDVQSKAQPILVSDDSDAG